MAARLVDEPAKLLLGMGIIDNEPLIGLRLLDCVEVLALDILDQRDFERLLVAEFADDRGNFMEPSALRRAPAPLAGDDLEAVAVRTDDDRLDQAARLDRGGELEQALLRAAAARLAAATWAERLLRRSNMVSATPRMDSSGLKRARIRSTVWSNWLSPSSAKNSVCSGTRMELAAIKALTVSRPSEGGQSIRQTSQRASATPSNALSSRCVLPCNSMSSISAP